MTKTRRAIGLTPGLGHSKNKKCLDIVINQSMSIYQTPYTGLITLTNIKQDLHGRSQVDNSGKGKYLLSI